MNFKEMQSDAVIGSLKSTLIRRLTAASWSEHGYYEANAIGDALVSIAPLLTCAEHQGILRALMGNPQGFRGYRGQRSALQEAIEFPNHLERLLKGSRGCDSSCGYMWLKIAERVPDQVRLPPTATASHVVWTSLKFAVQRHFTHLPSAAIKK